jgi:hypothetical protein
MPAGSGAPMGEIPNVPPLRTPAGSVVDRSNALPVPARKYGVGLTLQFGAPGGGGGAGVGAGAGGWPGGGAGVGPGGAVATSPPPDDESSQTQPDTRVEPSRPKRRILRRLI